MSDLRVKSAVYLNLRRVQDVFLAVRNYFFFFHSLSFHPHLIFKLLQIYVAYQSKKSNQSSQSQNNKFLLLGAFLIVSRLE